MVAMHHTTEAGEVSAVHVPRDVDDERKRLI